MPTIFGMAETTPLLVLEQLRLALAEPEPMCLVMIEVEPLNELQQAPIDDHRQETNAYHHQELTNEARVRLSDTLRRYDEIVNVGPSSWALILRTLADATVLAGRMRVFFDVISRPYSLHGAATDIEVQVVLGAAVRIPQDSPQSLVTRVEQAMESARSSGAIGPVVV